MYKGEIVFRLGDITIKKISDTEYHYMNNGVCDDILFSEEEFKNVVIKLCEQ